MLQVNGVKTLGVREQVHRWSETARGDRHDTLTRSPHCGVFPLRVLLRVVR